MNHQNFVVSTSRISTSKASTSKASTSRISASKTDQPLRKKASRAVFCLLALCLLAGCNSKPEALQVCQKSKDVQEAIHACQSALATNLHKKEKIETLFLLASRLSFAKSRDYYQQIIKLQPQNPWAYERLAQAQLQSGDWIASIESSTLAILITPSQKRYRLRALARRRLRDDVGADLDLAKARRLQHPATKRSPKSSVGSVSLQRPSSTPQE